MLGTIVQVYSAFHSGLHVLPKMMMSDHHCTIDDLQEMKDGVLTPTYGNEHDNAMVSIRLLV